MYRQCTELFFGQKENSQMVLQSRLEVFFAGLSDRI